VIGGVATEGLPDLTGALTDFLRGLRCKQLLPRFVIAKNLIQPNPDAEYFCKPTGIRLSAADCIRFVVNGIQGRASAGKPAPVQPSEFQRTSGFLIDLALRWRLPSFCLRLPI
jgi:hypothetical protein